MVHWVKRQFGDNAIFQGLASVCHWSWLVVMGTILFEQGSTTIKFYAFISLYWRISICDWLPVLHVPSISEWQWSIVLLRLISVNYPRFVYDTLMYHFVKFVHWEKSWYGTSRSNAFTALIMSPVVIPLHYYLHNPQKNSLPAVIPVAFPLRSNALINPLWLIPHHRGDSLFRRLSCDVS